MGERGTGRRAAAVIVAGLLGAAPFATGAAADHDAACADVTLVFARGSGQTLDFREAPSFFAKMQARLSEDIRVNAYELGTEAHGGEAYPAVEAGFDSRQAFKNLIEADASITGGLGGQYRASVRSGVTELTSYLKSRTARCRNEQIVIGGLSQGAQVVGDTLPGLSSTVRDRIAFVSLFGDPKLYLPEGRGPFPPACRGKEFSTWRRGNVSCFTDRGVLEARNPYLPADIEERTGSWCDRNDPICNNNLADFLESAHDLYADDGGEMDEATQEIAEGLEARLPDRADDIDTSIIVIGVGTAGVDVAFIVDTTGSMAGRIGGAVTVADFVGTRIVNVRGRVALTEYRDAGDEFVAAVRVPLTTDIDSFRDGLGALSVDGGGDTPEALLAALMETFNTLDWRPGATKAAVVLTDAGYHDPDVSTGVTLSEVAARALEIDPVNVYPVVDSGLSGFYGPLASSTSGQVVIDSGNTAEALAEAIERIELRPVPLLIVDEFFAAPGDEVTFDASRSYDPDSTITSYEWDFDGDGTIDETTTGPVVSTVYPAPFEGTAEFRVRSADGGVANGIASVHIDDDGLTSETPGAPANLTAAPSEPTGTVRTVTLDWDLPAAGGPVESWVVLTGDGTVLGRLPADRTSLDVADVPLQLDTDFAVIASNRFGPGEAATITVAATTSVGTPSSEETVPAPPPSEEPVPTALRPTAPGDGPSRNGPFVGSLPKTGAEVLTSVAIALVLIVSGAHLNMRRRRPRRSGV